ncbi:MAG: hypothetical protein AB7F19_06815 [Candidatus Babeliales bacterium]
MKVLLIVLICSLSCYAYGMQENLCDATKKSSKEIVKMLIAAKPEQQTPDNLEDSRRRLVEAGVIAVAALKKKAPHAKKRGLSREIIQKIASHKYLPAIVHLDTFIGGPDLIWDMNPRLQRVVQIIAQ